MDVAIIYCKDCVFSQNTESVIKGYFRKIESEMEGINIELKFYDLREIEHTAVKIRKANVKIVIISHHFLEHLSTTINKQKFHPLARILNSNGVIALLVRIKRAEIEQNYGPFLPHFGVWNTLELQSKSGADSVFCETFTELVLRSYNARRSSAQPILKYSRRQDPGVSLNQSLDLRAYHTETGKMSGVLDTKLAEDGGRVLTIKLDKEVCAGDMVRVELYKSAIEGGDEDSFLANFQIPELFGNDRFDSLHVEMPSSLGTQERKVSPPTLNQSNKQILDTTIQRMPAYRRYLDEYISETLARHFKDGTPFQMDPELDFFLRIQQHQINEFPTIIHLTVYYGLERSVRTLLEEWNGLEMCEVPNYNLETPSVIAERMGFSSTIGKIIQDYKEVMVTWKAIQYMKNLYEAGAFPKIPDAGNCGQLVDNTAGPRMSGSTEYTPRDSSKPNTDSRFLPDVVVDAEDEEEETSSPLVDRPAKPFESLSVLTDSAPGGHYLTPPEPKPVLPPKKSKQFMTDNRLNAPGILHKKDGTIPRCSNGYIVMNENETSATSNDDGTSSSESESELEIVEKPPLRQRRLTPEPVLPSTSKHNKKEGDDKFSTSPIRTCHLDPTDVELMEIMIGVREKAISLGEVEDIFAGWKDRPDVKYHFQEKQKDLELMRAEYARIQAEHDGLPLFGRLIKALGMSRRKKSNVNDGTRQEESGDEDLETNNSLSESPRPTSPKLWGNAMSRKCVGVSYLDPSCFKTSDASSLDLSYLDPSCFKTSDTSSIQYTNIHPTLLDTEEGDKENSSTTSLEDNTESLEDLGEENDANSLDITSSDVVEDAAEVIVPPPIPPKSKKEALKLNFNPLTGPVRPPRKAEDHALHFVDYVKKERAPTPDYKNSPTNENK